MSDYKEIQESIDMEKTKELLEQLPEFCSIFYEAKQLSLTPKTQLNYARRVKMFMEFLHEKIPALKKKKITEFTLDDFASVTVNDAMRYVTYLSYRRPDPKSERRNKKKTVDSYVECVSTYYSYFIRNQYRLSDGTVMSFNPFRAIEHTKAHRKEVIYMDVQEQSRFLSSVSSGQGLSQRQLAFHDKTALREICICQILLDTGIRVSELVGLDVEDLDLLKCCMHVKRKGQHEDVVYYSDVTREIIVEYLESREIYNPEPYERALFLSSTAANRGGRLSVRSVERLVKKYAIASQIPNAHQITPHKLRSSFAMDVLAKSGNLALVQRLLGHENITTTTTYAQAQESDKIENRNIRYEDE